SCTSWRRQKGSASGTLADPAWWISTSPASERTVIASWRASSPGALTRACSSARRSSPTGARSARSWSAPPRRCASAEPRSARVFVFAPGARLLGLRLRGPLQQEGVVGRNERIGRGHRVRVVHAAVIAREGDETRVLAQAGLELGPYLPPPLLEPA